MIGATKKEVLLVDNNASIKISLWDEHTPLLNVENIGKIVAFGSAITTNYLTMSLKQDGPVFVSPNCHYNPAIKAMKTNKIYFCHNIK